MTLQAGVTQFADTRHTAPGALRVSPSFDVQFRGRQADGVDTRALQLCDHVRTVGRVEDVEGAQVSKCHPPLHTMGDGLGSDIVTGEHGGIV